MDSDVQKEFSPVNDDVIKLFLDYHWSKSYYSIVVASSVKIIYGVFLAISAFTHSGFIRSSTLV